MQGWTSDCAASLAWKATGLAALLVEDPAEALPLMSRPEHLVGRPLRRSPTQRRLALR